MSPAPKDSAALPTVPPDHRCLGVRRRNAGYCQRRAGHGTDHKGEGRCNLHGGDNPIKHGMRSLYARKRLAEAVEEVEGAERDGLRGEVALVRAGIVHLIDQAKGDMVPVSLLADLAERASRIEERDHKIRTSQAITLETLVHVAQQIFLASGQEVLRAKDRLLAKLPKEWQAVVGDELDAVLPRIEQRGSELRIPGREANR